MSPEGAALPGRRRDPTSQLKVQSEMFVCMLWFNPAHFAFPEDVQSPLNWVESIHCDVIGLLRSRTYWQRWCYDIETLLGIGK